MNKTYLRASLSIILVVVPLQQPSAQWGNPNDVEPVDLWRLCKSSGLEPKLPLPEDLGNEMLLEADTVEGQAELISRFNGNVELFRRKETIHSDSAVYDQSKQEVFLKGNVHFRSDVLEFNADSMRSYLDSDRSEIFEPHFYLTDKHFNGIAERIDRLDANTTFLYKTTLTTCDIGTRDWYLSSSKMKLNHAKGVGTSTNTVLRLKKVPIFYFPWISFPISEDRRSGFLYPTIGRSDRHGTEIEIPWYWNIAPQGDATFNIHNMTKRGLKVDSEWRYLTRWSKNELVYEYIDDSVFGDKRSLLGLSHSGRIGRHWSTSINGVDISDSDYLRDFGDTISVTSQFYASSTASISGNWQNWRFTSRFQSYQAADDDILENNLPYQLSPDLLLNGLYSNIGAGVEFQLESTHTTFDHNNRINGTRFDAWPQFSRPFGGSSWYITPKVGHRYTSYTLESPTDDPVDPEEITRSIPVSSLDAGLIFERNFGKKGNYLQTLEPRLFYLNVPFRDQEDIPTFDTRQPPFGYFRLFEENRFVGADRMGDARQVSLALTSRWLQRETGRESLRLGLGQIYYAQDRNVVLPGQEPETSKKSGIIGNLEAYMGRYWKTSYDLEWNPDTRKVDKQTFRLRYNRQNRYVVNAAYRFRRDSNSADPEDIDQADISFVAPVGQKWSVFGRWHYSFEDDLDLQKFAGFEYESCCWAFRIMLRRLLIDSDSTDPASSTESRFDDNIYFEIAFKGLSTAGSGISRRLQENITGYDDPFD